MSDRIQQQQQQIEVSEALVLTKMVVMLLPRPTDLTSS
jgi:hypothetical protein